MPRAHVAERGDGAFCRVDPRGGREDFFAFHDDGLRDGLLREGREGLRGLGRGAMESQCSQNQNRFKRRGQFWSKGGFASFLEAYVWYTNDEIKYLYRPAA